MSQSYPEIGRTTITATASGTAYQVADRDVMVPGLMIQSISTNTGKVYIGNSSSVVASTAIVELSSGQSVTMNAAEVGVSEKYLNLKNFWINFTVAGEFALISYIQN